MDQNYFLNRLKTGLPLFDHFPKPVRPMIMGTESEYGVATADDGEPIVHTHRLPVVLENFDMNRHLEYASPEVPDAVHATAYYEAGKIICARSGYSPKLYCHNNDWQGQTFGSHENYFNTLTWEEKQALVPFLVARTILCGAGWQNDVYSIAQRPPFVKHIFHLNTTDNRGILNTRNEPLSSLPGWNRLHLILGDANMSQMSTFIRLGFTGMVIELAEMAALPCIRYSDKDETVLADLNRLTNLPDKWLMLGIEYGPKDPIELLSLYLERANAEFGERDEITMALIAVIRDTLEKLASNFTLLEKRLDWMAKLRLIEEHGKGFEEWGKRAIDLAYHDLDRECSLYTGLLLTSKMEKTVSDLMTDEASVEPPKSTRAYARGRLVKLLAEEGRGREVKDQAWEELMIVDESFNRPRRGQMPSGKIYWRKNIVNPFENYWDLFSKVEYRIRSGRI